MIFLYAIRRATLDLLHTPHIKMSKRTADESDEEVQALKAGQRPVNEEENGEDMEFEDEFEDEFESEDEILEAGVDGRPDEEREAEEREGKSARQIERSGCATNDRNSYGSRPRHIHSRKT